MDASHQVIELVRQDLRQLDGDLYLSHLFSDPKIRNQILVYSTLYCQLRRIRQTLNEDMIRLIRYQWWLDTLSNLQHASPSTPIVGLLQVCQLPDEITSRLVDLHIAQIDQGDVSDADIGAAFFSGLAAILGAQDLQPVLERAGFCWERWRMSEGMNGAELKQHMNQIEAVKNELNALPRSSRKRILPCFLLLALAYRQSQLGPRGSRLFGYLVYLVFSALRLKIR